MTNAETIWDREGDESLGDWRAPRGMTTADLRKAGARYQRAFRRSEALREQRDALIRQALEEGWTHARIAEATGLTRGRIGQMAQKRVRSSASGSARTGSR